MTAPTFVVVDCETTGLDATSDRIIELAAVRLSPHLEPVGQRATLVRPQIGLPSYVARLTGISVSELETAPSFPDCYPAFHKFVSGSVIVGHNVEFDRAFLAAEAARHNLPRLAADWLDTLDAALLLCPEADRYGLDALADRFHLTAPGHRALKDAITTGQLLRHLAQRAAQLPPMERSLLDKAGWRSLEVLTAIAPSLKLKPVAADAEAQPLARQRPKTRAAAPSDWRAAFDEPAGLAAHLPGFTRRPSQTELAAAAAATLADGGVGLFEAGTGMGKSLAYLLPAAFHSAAQDTRVVISTKTKALQRQLADHELPLVQRLAPPGWQWALLMGRENYICRRRLDEAVAQAQRTLIDRDQALALAYLVGRARSADVDLSNLPYRATASLPALAETARSVRSSAASCLRRGCPVRSQCHWRTARARAAAADLVCVNHALLLAGYSSLPPHEDVIIDEAHLLPDEASAALTRTVDAALLTDLERDLRGRRRQRPLADRLRTACVRAGTDTARVVATAVDEIQRSADTLPLLHQSLVAALSTLVGTYADAGEDYARSLWLRPALRDAPAWDAFADACADLSRCLSTLSAAAMAIAEELPEDDRDAATARSVNDVALPAAELLDEAPEVQRPHSVFWAQIEAAATSTRARRSPSWSLSCTPLSVAADLRTALWERLHAAILVSATLTVSGSFQYFRDQTGLGSDCDVRERLFASPFDYQQQARLVIEHDPQHPYSADEVPRRQADRLRLLAEVTGGRMLVLFTNRRQMEQVVATVGDSVRDGGVLLLAQGIHGSAATLADEFRAHPATVLLGVDTLWTGQDFPGDTLVCLVIAKLPFPRQGPLFEARRLAAQEDGSDWFRSFYLPEAVLRFRQGVGRLIRTERDRGVVVVLDHRITQKAYGRDFLESLPSMPVVRAAPGDVAATVEVTLQELGALPTACGGTGAPT